MDQESTHNASHSAPPGAGGPGSDRKRRASLLGIAGPLDDGDTKDIDVYESVLVTQRSQGGQEAQTFAMIRAWSRRWPVRLVACGLVWVLVGSMLPGSIVPGASLRQGTLIATDAGPVVRERSYGGLRGAERPVGDVTVRLELGDGFWTAKDSADTEVAAGILRGLEAGGSSADDGAILRAVGRWIDTKTPEVRAEGWLRPGRVDRGRQNGPRAIRGLWLLTMVGVAAWMVRNALLRRPAA